LIRLLWAAAIAVVRLRIGYFLITARQMQLASPHSKKSDRVSVSGNLVLRLKEPHGSGRKSRTSNREGRDERENQKIDGPVDQPP
jgi:hypothetical protein